jgi:hypothetical protein
MLKKILTLSLILSSSLILSACSSAPQTANSSPTPTPPIVTESQLPQAPAPKKRTSYEIVATQSGKVALDLLDSQTQVETKDYGSAGKFVTSINGLAGDNNNYWAFYLNGKYAEKGASQTVLTKNDIIRFVYEPVTPTK